MTPHFWVFLTLILQLYVKLYASHSKLAIFQNMQCSRKFALDFLNIAAEVYSSVARLSGDEINGTPKNSSLISKAMFLCTACTGSDCRSWKYVMAAMHNFAFACASRWSVATFLLREWRNCKHKSTMAPLLCHWVPLAGGGNIRRGLELFRRRQCSGGPRISWHHTVKVKMAGAVG